MAFTHQRTTGGALLRTSTDGGIQGECCCGGNPCDPDPSVELTVFDADYAGGDISWAGQTWTPAEVQAGASKTACPTNYQLGTVLGAAGAGGLWEKWTNNSANRLVLQRYYTAPYDPGYPTRYAERVISIFGGAPTYVDFWRSSNYGYSASNCQLNVLCGSQGTSSNSYRVLNGQFGSYTAAGVQYSWARGQGW